MRNASQVFYKKIRGMSYSVPLFIQDVTKVNKKGGGDAAQTSTVYAWFQAWCDATNHKIVTVETMSKYLRKANLKIIRTSRGNFIYLLNNHMFHIDTSDKYGPGDNNAKHFSHDEKVEWWKTKLNE